MNTYPAKNIINVAMAGHSGAGKTSLAEAMLYLAGASDRRGKVGEGNTVCDSDPEEIRRKTSVSTAVAPFEWKNKKINLLDTPGLFDFQGGLYEAARAAESVVIVLAGKSGVSVGTEKDFAAAEKRGLSKIFFVNGLCDEGSDFYKVFEDLKASFGPSVCPIVVPYFEDGKADKYINMLEYKAYDYSGGKPVQVDMPNMGARLEGLRTAIYEAVAETSDELFEKYFSGEEFTPEEVIVGVSQGVKSGTISPVFCGDAMLMRGMEQFMDGLCWLAPSAADKGAEIGVDVDGNPVEIAVKEDAATAAIVFKTVSDQYGKFSLVKVVRGKITGDMSLYDTTTGNTEKLGRLYTLKGKKNEEVKEICCGDIGAIAKMDRVKTGDTLCDPKSIVKLAGMPYAEPCYSRAIAPKTRGQEEKLGTGLNRLNEEDPTFTVVNNAETHQMVVSGAGDIQIDVLVSKLKTRFGVDAELDTPRVPYREKIRKTVQKQGRHKKQTGGSGQFGDVWVRFEPNEESEEMVFAEEVFGGSVPKNFFPAVEKGLREAVLHGPLAGYPVVNLKCVLYDGSYHPVDSSEIAFKTAANLAYKAAMPEASPVLLEPVCELKVTVPDQYMGDILGDLNKRRGRVMGMTPTGDGEQIIEAECPEAELMSYAIDLRSMTQSRGSFTMHFVRYEQCSADAQEKAVAAAKAMQEAE